MLITLYIAYFGYAMHHEFHVGLLVLTLLAVVTVVFYYLFNRYGETVYDKTERQRAALVKHWRKWIKW